MDKNEIYEVEELSNGEKIYIVIVSIILLSIVISHSLLDEGRPVTNILFIIAPICLGVFKREEEIELPEFSPVFLNYVKGFIFILAILFIWETNPNPMEDPFVIVTSAITFLMLMVGLYIIHWIGYALGNLIHKLVNREKSYYEF